MTDPYQPKFFKFAVWPIRGNQPHPPHLATCSLSHFLSHLSSLNRAIYLVVSSPFLRQRHACATCGRSPAVDEPAPGILAGDELRWSSSWSPEVPPPIAVFGKFWHHLTSFHGETTYFGMRIWPSRKPYPLVGRILTVEKWVTIHTMPSTAFSGEPG